jgi:hypothetical protein
MGSAKWLAGVMTAADRRESVFGAKSCSTSAIWCVVNSEYIGRALHSRCGLFGNREVAFPIVQAGAGGPEVNGRKIVDSGLDASCV